MVLLFNGRMTALGPLPHLPEKGRKRGSDGYKITKVEETGALSPLSVVGEGWLTKTATCGDIDLIEC